MALQKKSFLKNIAFIFRACNSSDVVYFVYYIIKVINKALGSSINYVKDL